MKKKFYLFLSLLLALSLPVSSHNDVKMAEALLRRLIPAYADSIEFRKIKSGKDVFRLERTPGSKVLICGNNANSMAVGLNHYLKYYCLANVSWYADIPVEVPDVLPQIPVPVEAEAKVEQRFFLNYCTFGYSMPFWEWNDWERLIDWMALSGVNMPLAITGQEAVWFKVWKDFGMQEHEIRSYFTGPVYLPWHRMANIDSWNGPLPEEWLEKQVELQKLILARERELNMKPVLPAFNGHVPAALKRLYPDADIQTLGKWGGFDKPYHCSFLNPEDPLFARVQKRFLREQRRLFGTDHIYGIDPFNEGDPPSWEPEYLKQVSHNLYRTLAEVDPQAVWLQMAWMFYFDRKKWTAPRIGAFLEGVPRGKMLMLDYHCENVELWRATGHFHGQPYIWCYLGNFGGNTGLTGNVRESGRRLDAALKAGGGNLKGIGSTLEGLDVVQFPYEYTLEKAWTTAVDDKTWVDRLADRHAGTVSPPVREAWQSLFNDIYVQVPKTVGVLPNYRPVMGKENGRTQIEYSNHRLLQVWEKLLQADSLRRDALELDIITVGRQLLGNYFLAVKREFDRMFRAGDLPALNMRAAEMREILNDIDCLASYHEYTSLSRWIADARAYGSNASLQDYYEKNARNLITTWGGTLNDYASRTWSGLVSGYYAKRWELYMDEAVRALEAHRDFDQKALDQRLNAFEAAWVADKGNMERRPGKMGLLDYTRYLLGKYKTRIGVE